MAPRNVVDTCWICGTTISLEMCTFDVQGRPVHGPCLKAMSAIVGKTNPLKTGKRPVVFVYEGHVEEVLS